MAAAERGSATTHLCCPDCRLRFTAAPAVSGVSCPQCGNPLHAVTSSEHVLGCRLSTLGDITSVLPEAVAVSLPATDLGDGSS
jgi:transcription initiation factor IIE alpha subunit